MSPLRTLLVALIVPGLALAGCVTPPADVQAAADESAARALASEGMVLPTGADAVGFLDSYVMTHPFRLAASAPTQAAARDDLEALLQEFGLDTIRHTYSDTGVNILGVKTGTTKPDEWIVLSAHYDTTESTVYGAWDDGAGTAMLLALAQAGAQSTFERTIVYAFFDEEEQGLLGSNAFVTEFYDQTHLAANLNFDPPGLNWPCADAQGPLPVKIIFDDERTENDVRGYAALKAAVLAGLDAAQVPEEVRDFNPGIPIATLNGGGLSGTSDHASFNKVDVPAVFIGSAPTVRAGPAAGLSYLLHTPLDTKEQMEARCGGADLLEQAFQVEIEVTVHALSLLDGEAALSPE